MTAHKKEAIIELKGVTLKYANNEVIRNVDLKIHRGETKVILGPSGVGKSTILKAMLGLMRPKSGRIFIHGVDITQLPERDLVRLRLKMAMVFQHGALFDSMTVGDNVSYRLREFAMADRPEIDRRVQEVLQFVGLQGARKLRPAQLSGGMRKRVAIARALAPDPDIFLFDEPTVGLDPINMYNTEQLMLKLKQNESRSMVIVTHDVESAYRLADKIVMLHEGKFIFEGTPTELKKETDERIKSFLDPHLYYSQLEKGKNDGA
jgi:phospholipid/cholesterol/gamma-HCH transport system ATP-binding protein